MVPARLPGRQHTRGRPVSRRTRIGNHEAAGLVEGLEDAGQVAVVAQGGKSLVEPGMAVVLGSAAPARPWCGAS